MLLHSKRRIPVEICSSFDACMGAILTSCCLSMILLNQGCTSGLGRTNRVNEVGTKEMRSEGVARPPSTCQGGPVGVPIILLEKRTCDLGKIKPGRKGSATFPFTNAGDAALKIMRVKTCCGVVAKLNTKELASGETAEFQIEYRAGHYPGPWSKTVVVFTNDPNNPQVPLVVKGEVVQTLVWTPTRFELSAYDENQRCPSITVKSLNGALFSIKAVSATNECLTVDFDSSYKANQFTLKPKVDVTKIGAH